MFIKVMMLMMLITLRVFASMMLLFLDELASLLFVMSLTCSVTNSVSGVFNFGIDVIEYQ